MREDKQTGPQQQMRGMEQAHIDALRAAYGQEPEQPKWGIAIEDVEAILAKLEEDIEGGQ